MSFQDLSIKKVGIFFCVAIIFSIFAHTSNAQTDALRVTVVPKYPGPFETVFVSVEDFSRDLNKVNVSWSINGATTQEGIGLKKLRFNTGGLGSVSRISINMGGNIQEITIRPASTDLLWQADTYTPPFYMGKALHSNEDSLTVVAEPFFLNSQGVRLDPETLIYKWSQGGKLNNAASGYGKKTFRVVPSILLKPVEIEVEVSSTDGAFKTNSLINIPDSDTQVLLYENNPLLGIMFEKTLNDTQLTLENSEVRILGMPLFFSNSQKKFNQLVYGWSLNNSPVNQQGNEVIFRKPEGTMMGKSSVFLGIENTERRSQSSDAKFSVTYNNEAQNSDEGSIF